MSLLQWFNRVLPSSEATVLGAVDVEYAVSVARRVAGFGTYERGFRPAGSEAARRCAEWLAEELRRIGLRQVTLEEFPLDGWEFAGARVEPVGGRAVEAVAYGGATGTAPEGLVGDLVDCGCGTAPDYDRVDVRGKIALVEMDLDALNWPGIALLEAERRGAAGVICWPANNYALLPGSFHCHDLQVHSPVPMLNVSREDGRALRAFERARIWSSARQVPGAVGRNVLGMLPGTERPEEIVIIGDHYDAWFDGFMDDAVGVGAVMALAKAAVDSGYRPRRTLAFVLHDAEEYGQQDSPWDWCTGAFAQAHSLRPDWAGRAVGAVIFELCGFKEAPTFEWFVSPDLAPLAEDVMEELNVKGRYPLGKRLHRLVSTWEDSFSYTIAGIPSAANLEITEYVRSHYYHTQFDTEELLDREKYALHLAGLGLLALRLDQAALPPLDLAAAAHALRRSLPGTAPEALFGLVDRLEQAGRRINGLRGVAVPGGEEHDAVSRPLLEAAVVLNRGLTWIGGDGMDETMYPHEQPLRDLRALKAGHLGAVAGMGWGPNVSYEVYRRQLFRHTEKPGQWQQWATGRVCPYLDVWHLVTEGREAPPALIEEARRNLHAAYAHETGVLTEALAILNAVSP